MESLCVMCVRLGATQVSPGLLPGPQSLKIDVDHSDSKTAYERILYNLHHDPRYVRDASVGKRVGFYRFRGELGSGNFSTVKLAFHQLTKDKVAVKVIEKSKLDHKTQRMLGREIANMENIAHPNIIRLFEVVETFTRINLVLEYAPGGELFNKVSTEGRMTESESAHVFSQVLSAVSYLHECAIVHRDIKAENVFLAANGRIKLGDFGFSTRITSQTEQLSTFCGSPPYAAPELYKDESYHGPAVDLWALGVLLYFLITADMPFKSSTVAGLKRLIIAGSFLVPSYVSDSGRDLLNKLLVQSPEKRLSPTRISAHPWLYSCDTSSKDPLPSFMTTPRPLVPQELLSPHESHAYETLEAWGISKENLSQANNLGSRSCLIGTYRIFIHRHLEKGQSDLENGLLNTPMTETCSRPDTPDSTGILRSYTPKRRFYLRTAFNSTPKQRSRTCILL